MIAIPAANHASCAAVSFHDVGRQHGLDYRLRGPVQSALVPNLTTTMTGPATIATRKGPTHAATPVLVVRRTVGATPTNRGLTKCPRPSSRSSDALFVIRAAALDNNSNNNPDEESP